ncbi:MAG: RNA polymerase sigma factor SigM [Acidimicrobiia bacterium]|nr:RNA polymerase sigma factor SigM [Acidimicrobiia bacterium]MDX2468673.1 RNA polymerase sigma factor SigM [Acidimicrobiia bacterium]
MTSRAAEDVQLLNRYLGGDVTAFDELVRAHEDRVFGICLRMMRDREAALDAVQETFVTVFRKADRYEERAAFSTWLYRVAVNTCYDQLRKAKRRRTEPLPEIADPVDPRSGDEFEAVELRPEIEKALQRVPVDFRSAVVLVDLQGLALEQAAQILDVPIGTIKSRLFRGRKVLAETLGNLRAGSRHPRDE